MNTIAGAFEEGRKQRKINKGHGKSLEMLQGIVKLLSLERG
jgi:hypothetical protein